MALRRYARLVMVLGLLFATVVATAPTGSAQSLGSQDDGESRAAADEGDAGIIRLKSGAFSPDRSEIVNADAARGYFVVQFDGPITQADADALAATGGRTVAYLPEYAYKVRMNGRQAVAASAIEGVTWVGAFQPEFKLSGSLSSDGLYRIRIERDADVAATVAAIEGAGLEVASVSNVVVVDASREALAEVASIEDVAWIENFSFREKHNEFGAGVIVGANTANALGYNGSSQIVAVADTGVGNGTTSGVHPDIPGSRVAAVYDWPGTSQPGCYTAVPDGAQDVDSGHGTHVSVSVLGDGDATGQGTGTAPGASLVFQATEDYASFLDACAGNLDGYYLIGLPDDLQDLLQQAYDAGARIHSDSWGSSVFGAYTADAAQVDDFMWDNPDFLMTTSAGNSGQDNDANGVIDPGSMGSPATAKNVLSVGASENDRGGDWACDLIGNGCTGQNEIFTYGSVWPNEFPVAPLADDPSAGNAEQMAAFSSTGPTDDGRIKPDVVAPGTWILSGYSDLYQEGYDGGATNPQNGAFQYDGWGFPVSEQYKYMGGTSMSNPIAAGAAAVVRDYYNKAHGHDASGALAKASLINSAVDLLDENNDGFNDNDFPIPNGHEGWGRIDVGAAVDGQTDWVDETTGVGGGSAMTYEYTANQSEPFKVSLVWADFASTEAAAINLVNDLDLTVTAPDGTEYRGNVFSGGWSTIGGSADRLNNVENVYVESASAGTWTVTVAGFNVPFGPQPFALVVDAGSPGGIDNSAPNPAFSTSCSDLTCSFFNSSTDPDGLVVASAWTFGDGETSAEDSPTYTYAAGGDYPVSLTVTDDDGAQSTVTSSVTVTDPAVENVAPVADFSASCTDLTCAFTNGSTDVDGSVVSSEWDFGDGGAAVQENPSYQYATGGAYIVTLTVTDDDGATNTVTDTVTVIDPPVENVPPVAAFSATCTDLTCVFTNTSNDPDGAVVSSDWDFGDGGASAEDAPSHAYATPGEYTVALTVTDDDGATNTVTTTVAVTDPVVENVPPVAVFAATCTDLSCVFSNTSSDPDGAVVASLWDFGDGGTSTQEDPSYSYAAAGTYTVTLTVTDDDGATNTVTDTVTVTDPVVENVAPVAAFTASCTDLTCAFTNGSTDVDGSVVSSEWDFGDGGAALQQDPTYAYVSGGTYTVALTVTDDDGATNTVTDTVTVTDPVVENVAPVAVFTSTCTDLSCVFSNTSSDPDGAVVASLWDFGDGGTSTQEDPSYAYAAAETYTVTLTVTDDDGATNTVTDTVTVTDPAVQNVPPVAVFTAECTDLTCVFANTSSDPDGAVVASAWEFGDGATTAQEDPSHAYAAAGTYTVALTVTDNDGATNTMTTIVKVGLTMHVGDLDGVGIDITRAWVTIVTILVIDDGGAPVSGAVVSGFWRRVDGTCTTNDAGLCEVEVMSVGGSQQKWTVTGITGPWPYAPENNTDPDGDSDGTVISVLRPE